MPGLIVTLPLVGIGERRGRVAVQELSEGVPCCPDAVVQGWVWPDLVQQAQCAVEYPQVGHRCAAHHELVLDLRHVVRGHLAALHRLPKLRALATVASNEMAGRMLAGRHGQPPAIAGP